MSKIVKIHVSWMYETCNRFTFAVTLTNEEGLTLQPTSFRTGSDHEKGLSIEEARDRALIEADTWGDFLEIEPTPFKDEDGKRVYPSISLSTYKFQRRRKHDKDVQTAES